MHEWGDSGIAAILLSIFVAVVLSLVVAQHARSRAARKQDVRRRLIVAAEEARREEAEAHAEYTSMVAYHTRCATCLNPTATRCSRCKAVHYCSSACQSRHWNLGHKQECRAPQTVSPKSSSNGSRHFSDVFSSGSSASGSRTLSEVSDLLRTDDLAPAQVPKGSPSINGVLTRPTKILFPYEKFVKFFNSESLQVPPCGLINCGNSCFANVVLQCLTYTRPLTAFLLEGSHGEECSRNDWCFMCELQDHVWRIRQNHNPISPIRILSRIRNIGNHLGYGKQEDAHEFMRFAIDSMQSISLDEAGGEKSVDACTQETTLIHHIFGGHLQSQVKCMQCLHESNRYESMMDLAVEIQGCVETLEDALAQFTAPELLDGENKYKCDRCNAYVKARKRLTIHEAPNILTVALKRFQSGKFGKLNKRVTFPEVLDIMPYMSGKGDKPPVYSLYAVVVHVDMLNASFFGHYICYVKDSQGLWYKIDDSKVKEVDLEKVMTQRAYMLFYTRSSARPPPVVVGAMPTQKVIHPLESVRPDSDHYGGLKVYSAPVHLQRVEIPIVEKAAILHDSAELNHMLADDEKIPETGVQHSLSNGEVVQPQHRSWEMEGMHERTPDDNEVSVEEYSGCVSNGTSLSMTSPCMSSFRSNPGLWIPNQGFVCGFPNPLTTEGTECLSVDQNDFSEVSLHQSTALDKPCNGKAGKRRLEDSLSPLPTPKPLDTDQLPAWPAGNHGRSVSCPPGIVIQSSRAIPNESSVWSKNDSEQNGDSPLPAALPVSHRVCGEQMSMSIGEELGHDSERICSVALETIGEGEEPVARAKRQHVEIDTKVDLRGIHGREERSQAGDHASLAELGGRDMDWDDSRQESESTTLDPVTILRGDNASADPRKYSIRGEMQTQRHMVSREEAIPSTSSNMNFPECGNECQETIVEDSGRTMQLSTKSCIIQNGNSESCVELNFKKTHHGYNQNTIGELHVDSVESLGSIQASHRFEPPSIDTASSSASNSGNAKRLTAQPLMDHATQENVMPVNESDSELDRGVSKESSCKSDPQSTGPVLDREKESVPQVPQKIKLASKPLFTPGFLNRVRTPSNSITKEKSSVPVFSQPLSSNVNGHINKGEDHGRDGVTDSPEVGQSPLLGGILGAAMNGPSPAVINGHENFGSQNSVNLDDGSEILHTAGNGTVHNKHNKKITEVEILCDDESVGKLRNAIRGCSENGTGSANGAASGGIDEDHPMDAGSESVAPSAGVPVKQKQGRNETCNCGSQRKWKKCCGKAGVMKPEPGRRRLVV